MTKSGVKKCLWNDSAALRAHSTTLKAQGFVDAAAGCLERAKKVDHLFHKFGPEPKNTRPFEEPVDARG